MARPRKTTTDQAAETKAPKKRGPRKNAAKAAGETAEVTVEAAPAETPAEEPKPKRTRKPRAAAAKTADKPATRKNCKTSVNVEMAGVNVSIADVQNAVKKIVKAQGLNASELNIYINAAEKAAYYTVNGEGGSDYKVDLTAL